MLPLLDSHFNLFPFALISFDDFVNRSHSDWMI